MTDGQNLFKVVFRLIGGKRTGGIAGGIAGCTFVFRLKSGLEKRSWLRKK